MYSKKLQCGVVDTAELMVQFPNSIFMDEIYDEAIMGINPINGSIIYSMTEMLRLYIEFNIEELPFGKQECLKVFKQCINRIQDMFTEIMNHDCSKNDDCVRFIVGFKENTTSKS